MKGIARNIAMALVGLGVILVPSVALAQAYPAKTITLVVPFPPGGTTDVLARSIAQKMGESWGQSVIVDNRPGAGATIGAAQVAKAPADGYTLLMGAVHHTIATSIYAKLPYDFQKDFAPLTVIAMVPNVLAVSAASPAKTVADLVAMAKAANVAVAWVTQALFILAALVALWSLGDYAVAAVRARRSARVVPSPKGPQMKDS